MSYLNKFQQNIYLVKSVSLICCLFNLLILISHRDESRTSKATMMEVFVSTINDSQPLTALTKNFVLDAAGVLNLPDRLSVNFK